MDEARYSIKIGGNVIEDRKSKIFLTNVFSEKELNRKFFDEEATYCVGVKDVDILQESNGSYVEAVRMTFVKESEDEKAEFLDMIICCHLGTFASTWH